MVPWTGLGAILREHPRNWSRFGDLIGEGRVRLHYRRNRFPR